MTSAVWVLLYDIARENRDEYVAWFHDVHIPEKLARPGYTWAAHYAGSPDADTTRYVALFGGENTRVFHDPSPGQLRTRQGEDTRRMMGMRLRPAGTVCCEEWRFGAADAAVHAPVIHLDSIEVDDDDDLQAWLVQEHAAALETVRGFRALRKLLGASGAVRHTVVTELESNAASEAMSGSPMSPWRTRIEPARRNPAGPARVAGLIWPPTGQVREQRG